LPSVAKETTDAHMQGAEKCLCRQHHHAAYTQPLCHTGSTRSCADLSCGQKLAHGLRSKRVPAAGSGAQRAARAPAAAAGHIAEQMLQCLLTMQLWPGCCLGVSLARVCQVVCLVFGVIPSLARVCALLHGQKHPHNSLGIRDAPTLWTQHRVTQQRSSEGVTRPNTHTTRVTGVTHPSQPPHREHTHTYTLS
jgi:hypothetical protein